MLGSRHRLFFLVLATIISPGRVSPRGSSALAPKRRSSSDSIPQGSPTPTPTPTPIPTSTLTATPTARLAHIEILVESYAEPDHYFCGSALSRTYDQSPIFRSPGHSAARRAPGISESFCAHFASRLALCRQILSSLQNIRHLPPSISVVVSMREFKRHIFLIDGKS